MENAAKKQCERRGFTLIELLMVIAIIGILSTIGIAQLKGGREKARNAQAAADARAVINGLVVLADDADGGFPISQCNGRAPSCFSYSTGVNQHTCIGAGKPGEGFNSYCRIAEGSTSPCIAGVLQDGDDDLNLKLKPYIDRDILLNPIESPVSTNFTSGYPSFAYISNSPGGTFWGHTVAPGAYLAWFKTGCQSFSDSECPGGLFLPSSCGNAKNGCAFYLGKNSADPGEPTGNCASLPFYPANSMASPLKLRWF